MNETRYPYMLTPARVGKRIFRNRLLAGPCVPVFGQSAEIWPSDAWIECFVSRAKSGASGVVCCGMQAEVHPSDDPAQGHMDKIDGLNPNAQHRFAEIAEMLKAEGAVPFMQCMPPMGKLMMNGYDVSEGIMSEYVEGDGSRPMPGHEIPAELLYEIAKDYGAIAALGKELGFQGVQIHMAYRHMLPGRFLSPSTNKRTDEFGGCLENRARFPLMVCEEIKKQAGEEMLVHISMTAEEPFEDGLKLEDTLKFMELAEGKIDLISMRGYQIDAAQGPHFIEKELPNRDTYHKVSSYLREHNISVKLAYVCGADDLDNCEDLIRSRDADFVIASRAFVSNPNYGQLLREGRGEDVVPCIRCNKCHQYKPNYWHNLCSVNPEYAISHRDSMLKNEPGESKNIGIIGGGCAGMKAAIDLFDRGHTVTIYEKEGELGGQLNLAGIPKTKWTQKRFRNYLVSQVEKRDIKVMLNTKVKPGDLDDKHDLCFVALGAEPIKPNIPGADAVMTFQEALTDAKKVRGNVIVIGGGEIGLELSIWLTKEHGHKTKCIEMGDMLAKDMAPVHFRRPYREMWEKLEDFSWELNAMVTKIVDHTVYYLQDGEEKAEEADTIILAVGTRGLSEEAMAFGKDDCFRLIGDCKEVGNIATAMRTAHFEACKL